MDLQTYSIKAIKMVIKYCSPLIHVYETKVEFYKMPALVAFGSTQVNIHVQNVLEHGWSSRIFQTNFLLLESYGNSGLWKFCKLLNK